MKKLINFLFSATLMGFLILFMALSAATATFIESKYGAVAARAVVYDAWWFKLDILLIIVNLTGNMFIWKVYKKKKLTIFLFHIAFVFIFLGAAVTRYISYEGTMHIREGQESSTLLTSNTWIIGAVGEGNDSVSFQKKVLFSPGKRNRFKKRIRLGNDTYTIRLVSYMPSARPVSVPDILQFRISGKEGEKKVYVRAYHGQAGEPAKINLGNARIRLQYGARVIKLPFSLYLKNFQLQRYPGSNSPSSYASEVVLLDPDKGIKLPYNIHMNHVLNYRGFRFFQSSYDRDEKGTILSVNHDAPGTILTYIGYFFMTLGMLLSIFNKNSRFMKLAHSIDLSGAPKKIASVIGFILIIGGLSSLSAVAKGNVLPEKVVTKAQAGAFRDVLVQDQGGRIKPFETLASEIVRKVAYKSSVAGYSPEQVVLSMIFYPREWQKVPMIRVSNKQVRKMVGVQGSFAAFTDFFDNAHNNAYKLSMAVQRAYRKDPVTRSKVDQDIIKTDERLNICYLVYTGKMLRLFPVAGDPENRWYNPVEATRHTTGEDSVYISQTVNLLFTYIREGNNKEKFIRLVDGIKKYQRTKAAGLIPSPAKIRMEIFYNKAGIFEKLSMVYGFMGFVLLVLLFFYILLPNLKIRPVIRVSEILIATGFVFHTLGLILRWYISGHAPWSNGYESMIYIAWVTVLAGVVFARKSPFALAAGGILAALTLFVAHLSWMSPEITNLVPVLKSYWLSIHVSVITASYGFLGMGMVLGLFNLFLLIFRTDKNKEHIDNTITTLTRINEMTLILGVYFIFIGTFLGGVWANESWGRYWGWDPKETWALVTGLVYVFIIHMRLIPGLRGEFAFNLASVLGFFSVIMTYFGVNYYLSGLHSYASGEAAPIPTGVFIGLGILATIILLAWRKRRLIDER